MAVERKTAMKMASPTARWTSSVSPAAFAFATRGTVTVGMTLVIQAHDASVRGSAVGAASTGSALGARCGPPLGGLLGTFHFQHSCEETWRYPIFQQLSFGPLVVDFDMLEGSAFLFTELDELEVFGAIDLGPLCIIEFLGASSE